MAGAPVTIAASATDADGTIARVEFHRNASGTDLIAVDTSAPYSISTTFNAGTYSLTAVAIDNLGARTTSAPVAITVQQDQPPTIAIVSPQPGSVIHSALPPDVLIVADVADPENAIAEVRFYMNGNPADEMPTFLGSTAAPPYEFLWAAVPHNEAPGNPYIYGYDVYAEVTDGGGNTVQSEVVSIAVHYAASAHGHHHPASRLLADRAKVRGPGHHCDHCNHRRAARKSTADAHGISRERSGGGDAIRAQRCSRGVRVRLAGGCGGELHLSRARSR